MTNITAFAALLPHLCQMEIIGYIAAAIIGVSLGLLGAGGSILTVPVLVYLFKTDAVIATSYSLFIVGTTSLVGAGRNYFHRQVNTRIALLFGSSSMLTVFSIRKFVIPAIPSHLFTIGRIDFSKQTGTLLLFAMLMLIVSFTMIRNKTYKQDEIQKPASFFRLTLLGLAIGIITGFLGAGGGFILIPALVLLLKLPMKEAVGTSLLIIALNSLVGFTGDIGHININWPFLLTVTAIAVTGIFAGAKLSSAAPAHLLKKGFGWFVLIMGVYILVKELYIN